MAAISRALTVTAPARVTPQIAAQALCRARLDGRRVSSARLRIQGHDEAYAIQDATLAAIGPVGGWKVGAPGPGQQPICAPLPAAEFETWVKAKQGKKVKAAAKPKAKATKKKKAPAKK